MRCGSIADRYCVAVLPDWIDPDILQWIILGVIGILVLATALIIRTIQKLVMRVLLIAILAGFGISLWVQRADLQDCVETCECSLYGREVRVDYDQLPDAVQDRIDSGDTSICRGVVRDG